MTTINQPKATVGFKVALTKKAEIESTAQKLGLNVSQYLEGLVFRNHDKINELCNRQIQIPANVEEYLLQLIQPLKAKYPNLSELKLIALSLKLANDNENRIISNKIKNYLR